MPAFHVVIKLLMLRLLLASLSGLSDHSVCLAYDFGYHPSAEEFDSLLRDTRTWTRNVMANERHRESFVPRYNYQQQAPKAEFNFQLFDDDDDQEQQEQQQMPFIYEAVPTMQPQQQQQQGVQGHVQQVQSQLLQINDAPTAAASPHSTANNGSNSSNPHSSSSGNNFPIFFTNPATGIVYAISEVGSNTKSQPWPSNDGDNEAIAIYVTKAQYDADLKAMRLKYEQQCPLINGATSQSQSPFPTVSMAMTSTARPQIIRLQKPKKTKVPAAGAGSKPLGSNKLPYRPPPVMVTTGNKDSISDQLLKLPTSTARPQSGTPSRTPRPKRGKRKKKKKLAKRKPGHKQPASTAGPQIVLGKRTTSSPPPSSLRVATQLEKPHMPEPTATATGTATAGTETIFSEQPFAVSGGYLEAPHHLTRRSLDAIPTSAAARPISSGRRRRPSSTGRRRPGTGTGTGTGTASRPKGQSKSPTSTSTKDQKQGGSGYHIPHAVHLLHSKHNGSEEEHQGEHRGVPRGKHRGENRGEQRGMKHKSRKHNSEDLDLFELMTGVVGLDDDDDDGIDDEHSDDNYYDDDSYSDNANEDNDDDNNDAEDEHKKVINRRKDSSEKASQENSSSAEEGADFGAMEELPISSSSSNNSSSSNSSNNIISSSTELPLEHESEPTVETLSSSKHSTNKKRIKRRPAAVNPNVDDYYDGDDDDDDDEDDVEEEKENDDDDDGDGDGDFVADSGIGSFFRMLFYPVQMAMSRIFDGFNDQSTEQSIESSTLKPKYPSYTLYHSAHSNNELIDEDDEELDDDADGDDDDDEQSNSLGNWFGSWFGYRRRNKKSGSTTSMPEAPLPLPTPAPAAEPAGWLDSWFGFGKTTTEASSEEDGYDKWFASWFDDTPKPKARRRKTTTTTTPTTTTPTAIPPQVPILTIVDPLRNPQNWIGILAHHIVNTTSGISTTTKNPLLQALATRVASSTTTTSQPEAVRRINYGQYQIWRLKPQDESQVRVLEDFKKGEDGNKLQWLKGPSLRGLTDVLVPPKMLIDFQGTLDFEAIAHEVLIFDVGKAIAYERTKEQYMYTTPATTKRPNKHQAAPASTTPPIMTWNKYYEYDDIIHYLETLRMRHTQLVELLHIGRSYEGRPLIVVKIESKQTAAAITAAAAASQKRLKHKRRSGQANAVFIEAGAQGQAWIGPASATWMISELVRYMRSNRSDVEHEFIRNTTWYIMPVLNPDGYVYSHEYDRFWKKSRSQHVAKPAGGLLDSAMTWLQQKRPSDKICYGVDLDRNWLYHWGKRGSSKAPCNEFYAGPAPFSEPETKAVSDFLMDYRTQIKLYISLQAYGQVLSYPVKANSTFNTERLDDFLDVAMVGTDSLRKKGSKTRYKVDASNDLIEQRSGCADAFAAYEIGIPFSFTLQLADNGVHGYLLPSSAIESTARDAFEIINGMLDYI